MLQYNFKFNFIYISEFLAAVVFVRLVETSGVARGVREVQWRIYDVLDG